MRVACSLRGVAAHRAHGPAALIVALTALAAAPAAAQSPTTPSAPSRTAALTGAITPAKPELVAGAIHARLAPIPTDTTFAVDNAAFAHLTLTSGSARASAEVVLEPEVAELRAVTGKSVRASGEAADRTRIVVPLRKGRPETVLVEVALRPASSPAANGAAGLNRLKITIRQQDAADAEPDSTVVTWAVADCAGGFYDRLTAIRESTGEAMLPAVKAASARDRERPGRWLFRPDLGQSAGRRCVRWARTWDFYSYRPRTRCTRYATVRAPARNAGDVSAAEREIYKFATAFVSAQASDPEMKQTRNNGWAAQRIATDLGRYLRQDKHPALCTGTTDYVGYFDDKLDSMHKRAASIAEHAGKARAVAVERIAALLEAVKAAPGGHPGWGAAPLEFTQPAGDAPLKEQVAAVAELMGEPGLAREARQAASAIAALKAMQDAFKPSKEALSAGVRAAARRALGAIEAADYLSAVEAKYAAISRSIDGSIGAIRAAHARHCTCGS